MNVELVSRPGQRYSKQCPIVLLQWWAKIRTFPWQGIMWYCKIHSLVPQAVKGYFLWALPRNGWKHYVLGLSYSREHYVSGTPWGNLFKFGQWRPVERAEINGFWWANSDYSQGQTEFKVSVNWFLCCPFKHIILKISLWTLALMSICGRFLYNIGRQVLKCIAMSKWMK